MPQRLGPQEKLGYHFETDDAKAAERQWKQHPCRHARKSQPVTKNR